MNWIDQGRIMNTKIEFGKKEFFRVYDNSWQTCLSDGYNHYLAGIHNQPGQTVEVIKGPYIKEVEWGASKYKCTFIIGKCEKGLLHEIIYSSRLVFVNQ